MVMAELLMVMTGEGMAMAVATSVTVSTTEANGSACTTTANGSACTTCTTYTGSLRWWKWFTQCSSS